MSSSHAVHLTVRQFSVIARALAEPRRYHDVSAATISHHMKELSRIAVPGDITSIAVFLASTDSGWLTGETILAGGGLR
jgi:hypothetical protein